MAKKPRKRKPRTSSSTKLKPAPKKPLVNKNLATKEPVEKAESSPSTVETNQDSKQVEVTKAKVLTISKLKKLSAKLTKVVKKHKTKLKLIFFILFTLFLVAADSWLNTERKVFDWLTFANSTPEEDKQVVIVKIDDEDFSQLFEKKSPLNPNRVTEIIEAISSAKPKVLGIDILTSDEIHREYNPETFEYDFPIVWAKEPIKKDGKFVEIKLPLARKNLAANNYSAVPESVKDSDGVNRLFRRIWNVNGKNHPTFAWQIYKLAYPKEAELKEENTEDYYIRFAGNQRYEISAREVLDWKDDEKKEHFDNKIVIVGGMYGDARDIQQIPFETAFGVQLNAAIVETEMQGNPQKPISGIWKTILNIIAFPLFAIIFFRYKFVKALIIAGVIIAVASLSISFFKYGVSSLVLLIPVYLWTLVLALLDLTMDKYKEIGSGLFDLGKNQIPNIFKKKN